MCDAWLQSRVPTARAVTTARLPGHVLRFHKRSDDGSAKCNMVKTGRTEDEVYGVIFEIEGTEKALLDKAEGLCKGYVEGQARGACARRWTECVRVRGGDRVYKRIVETLCLVQGLGRQRREGTWAAS